MFDRRTENLIANLRGLPENRSRSKWRDEREIGDLLDNILDEFRIEQPRIEQLLMRNWEEIMGSKYAHRCAPQRIIDGKSLVVFVGSATLKQEMEFSKRKLLQNIRNQSGCEGIAELVFRHG